MTRLASSLIEDLENDNLRQIAAPIYGRGFVRLYCDAVGINPKPLVDEFMEILNGNREPNIKERSLPANDAVGSEQDQDESASDRNPRPAPPTDLFEAAHMVPDPPACDPNKTTPLDSAAPGKEGFSLARYAAPFRAMRSAPPALWRIGALVLAALAVFALLIGGLRALRRTTSSKPASPRITETAGRPQTAPDAPARPTAARRPQDIPSLYID